MKLRTILILLAVAIAAAVAIYLFSPSTLAPSHPSSPSSPSHPSTLSAPPKAVSVNAIVVRPQAFEELVTLTGSVISNEAVEVRPEISGRIVSVNFREGQRVTKGQLLVKLFDADLQAQMKKTEHQVRLDEDKVRRLKQIRAVDGVSIEDLETAEATLEMHKAEIDMIKAQIAKTAILAPFNGVIGLRNVSEGAVVSPSTVITLLKDDTQLKLECTVPEKYATTIKQGTRISFSVRGKQLANPLTATVYATDPELDARSRTLRIRAAIDKTTDLLPGMFADVMLNMGTTNDAILVPTECVVVDIKGAKVFVAHNNRAREVRVETGTRSQETIRVLSGIAPGDTILTTGILILKDNMPVKVTVTQ
ncbi:MAG: efflux RND transporter periplasmic adaptor subunit [Ignavibacteriae bacterium]|nr:MAG: efflux RND transporter periplasmic adaptor subunit [Ignavibacteriota bacterium]